VRKRLEAVWRLDQLERLGDALFTAESWEALLATLDEPADPEGDR
jgi:hypothetical protein